VSSATPTQFAIYGLPAVATADFSGNVQDYLDASFGELNTYLRSRYSLPFSATVPIELVKAECVLAAYDLLSVRGFDPENGADSNIILRYKKTMSWLMAIAEGKVNLDIDADADAGRRARAFRVWSGRSVIRRIASGEHQVKDAAPKPAQPRADPSDDQARRHGRSGRKGD